MFKFKQAISRRRLLLPIGLLLGITLVWTQIDKLADLLVLRDPPTRSDVGVVFGGDPNYERTSHAVRLLQEGLVTRLILCGGEPGPGDHAMSLKKKAMERGVPSKNLLVEDRSVSTRESVEFIRPILEEHGFRSVTLVTSPYHQRRVFLAARKSLGENVTLINSPAEPSFWKPSGWWRNSLSARIVFSEYGKLAYYFFRGWI